MPSASPLARSLTRLCAILALMIGITACGGLGSEPLIVATMPPPTDAPLELGFPASPPDIAAGAAIFAANCTACHGANGRGDGDLVEKGQVQAPIDFTDPAAVRDKSPQEWFETITNGRIEQLMPPWKDKLSEQERWDVALYTYALHYTPDMLTQGVEIWESNCIDCHGIEGRGDGPEADRVEKKVGDLTNQEEMTSVSDNVIFNFISEGSADAMPSFADDLTEDEIWSAVAWARRFSLQNADVINSQPEAATSEPLATEDVSTPAETIAGAISGRITNGTAGGSVPPDMNVILFSIDREFNTERFETTADAEGNFAFTDVPISTDLSYATTVTYRERAFASEVVRGDTAADGAIQLPITIYELTEDPAVLTISGLVYQINAVGEGLQVAEVMIIQNSSDRMFTSSTSVGEDQFASAVITLPPGAVVLGFPGNQQRFIVSEDQKTVIATSPVIPGEDHIMQVVYFLPYENSAIIEQPLNYALEGEVRLLVRPDTVAAISEQLPIVGPQTVGGEVYSGYGQALTLNPSDVIRFELNGLGAASGAQLGSPTVSSNNLAVVVIVVLIAQAVLIGGLYYVYTRRAKTRAQPSTTEDKNRLIDALVKQIAELDEAHDRGDINHDLYHHQRKQLKARLAELMETKQE